MAARINWRVAESDADKADYWKKRTGSDASPIQAWYWCSGFEEEDVDAAFFDLLRSVFWSRQKKACVVLNVDVKIEESPYMVGVPIVRVTVPDRFVPSFWAGERLFVLCQARSGDAMVDYIGLWDSTLERRDVEASHTRFAGPLSGAAATDVPPPLAMIRGNRAAAPAARPVPIPAEPPPVLVPPPVASATDVPDPAAIRPTAPTGRVASVSRVPRPAPARLAPTLPEPPVRPRVEPPRPILPFPPQPPVAPAPVEPDPESAERDLLPVFLAAGIGIALVAAAILYALT